MSVTRKALFLISVLLAVGALSLIASRVIIASAARGKTYSDVLLIPHRRVGLVLGCPKRLSRGRLNLFFANRIDAAAELYQHGKIDYLIVSGYHHVRGPDEPTDMKNALLEKGVPVDRIYLDYAGFRTFDSVVRAKGIFGQNTITIISQESHNERAIFLASHRGIDAIGFNAADVDSRYSSKVQRHEQLAKLKAVLDIYLFREQPRFLGQKIVVIGNL